MAERQRCAWCHGTSGELRPVTLPAAGLGAGERFLAHRVHEEPLRRLHRRAARHWKTYLWALGGWVVLMVVFELVLLLASRDLGLAGMGLAIVLLGILVAGLPLPTPQTVRLWGARRAVVATRVAGVVLATVGAALMMLPLLPPG